MKNIASIALMRLRMAMVLPAGAPCAFSPSFYLQFSFTFSLAFLAIASDSPAAEPASARPGSGTAGARTPAPHAIPADPLLLAGLPGSPPEANRGAAPLIAMTGSKPPEPAGIHAGQSSKAAAGPFPPAAVQTVEEDSRLLTSWMGPSLPSPPPAYGQGSAPSPDSGSPSAAGASAASGSAFRPGAHEEVAAPETMAALTRKIEQLRSRFHELPQGPAAEPEKTAQATRRDGTGPAAGGGRVGRTETGSQPLALAPPAPLRPTSGQLGPDRATVLGTAASTRSGGQAATVAPGNEPAQAPFAEVAAAAAPAASPERKGLLGRIFPKKGPREARVAECESVPNRSSLESFPLPKVPKTRASKDEEEAQKVIERIYQEYVQRVSRVSAQDLLAEASRDLPPVPQRFDSVWLERVKGSYFPSEEPLAIRLEEVYARALLNSNQVKVYGYDPVIRESAIQEAEGAFDLELFTSANYGYDDEPTSTILDTGETGRRLESRVEAEAGLRRRFATGGRVSMSNRFLTLDSNSQFLEPNPQTTSSLVLSVVQPLLKGGGYHYNKARLKVAKIDAGMAAAEYIGRLEKHLLEVNQAYWGVYFARAAFQLRKSLVNQTGEIVRNLEARADEATASELLRARSDFSRRRTAVNRAEMAVRNSEERLRSLVNDPAFPIGGPGEFIPVTTPVLSPPKETVHSAAMAAVENRPEMAHSFGQLRIAAIRHLASKHETRPQLDVVAEFGLAGLEANRRVSGAYDDMLGQDASWAVGLQFSQPFENNAARARQDRFQVELLQQQAAVRSTMDTILLESVVTFRELMTYYRDLQGNYQQVLSTREELRGLRERLDVEADNEQTVAYRLQNVLDALDRNQLAEEQFLASAVSYNIAFAFLEKAKGTFLKYQDVAIERQPSPEGAGVEVLQAVPAARAAPLSQEPRDRSK